MSHSCWLHQELPQLGSRKQKHPKSQSTGCAWHILWLLPAGFSPPAWFPRHCWDMASEMLRWSQVTSLTMRPTHPCITIPSLLALLAPSGIPNVMPGQNLGCEAECSHKQLRQPCRDRAGHHQQMTWSPCASSWTRGWAHLAWGQQETLLPLSQRDFDDFCISVSPSCCPTPMHTNGNQLQRNMRLKASKNSLACTQTYFICLIKQRSCPWWITDIQLSGWKKNAQKKAYLEFILLNLKWKVSLGFGLT